MNPSIETLTSHFKFHREKSKDKRLTYPDQLKIHALELLESGISILELAETLEVHPTTIKNWMKRFNFKRPKPSTNDLVEISLPEEDIECPKPSLSKITEESFTSVKIISIDLKLPNSNLAQSLREALSGVFAAVGEKC